VASFESKAATRISDIDEEFPVNQIEFLKRSDLPAEKGVFNIAGTSSYSVFFNIKCVVHGEFVFFFCRTDRFNYEGGWLPLESMDTA
jgi:hypothetical protein